MDLSVCARCTERTEGAAALADHLMNAHGVNRTNANAEALGQRPATGVPPASDAVGLGTSADAGDSKDEYENEYEYPCKRCDWEYGTVEELEFHLREDHGLGKWRSWAEATGEEEPSASMPSVPAGFRQATRNTKKQAISQVGRQTAAGLGCPRCGGTQFKTKRSGKRKLGALAAAPLTLGASALILAKGSQVRCVACGTVYKRG